MLMQLDSDAIYLLRMSVRQTFIWLHIKVEQEMENKFDRATRDGRQRAKRTQEFWTHACLGPIVQGSLSVYPWLCLPP